jgi:glycosyltransferase involved in cell wall biosynthesis
VTVTVAVPFYGVPDLVERAVRSILAQTYSDLRCVVVGDGQEPKLRVNDSRLVVYTLPANRGTYFAFELILRASPDAWHAPHGADDWSDPTHLEKLLSLDSDAVAMGTCWVHVGDRARVESIGKEGWHVGIFSSERLKAIGGYDPSARLSQDTHVLRLLDLTGGYQRYRSPQPTYHIWKHPASLTNAPHTGMDSHARTVARARDRKILQQCRQLKTVARMKAYRESLVPAAIQNELAQHVERLRAQL